MLASTQDCISALRCPRTGQILERQADELIAKGDGQGPAYRYPLIADVPVVIDFDESLIEEEAIKASFGGSPIERKSYRGPAKAIKRLLSPEKEATRKNVARLRSLLAERSRPSRLLVVGGGTIGQGMGPLYDDPDIQIYAFDIYNSPYVQFVADAHQIPMEDDFFDAVIVQAVLEHVLHPAKVVAEIWRVLKPDGIAYAETPFMQQVHEGPYDFTRFSENGHRYLFRRFELIDSGASSGPGTQFMWSVDYLTRSVFRSVRAGKAAKLAFFWTQYLDRIIPPAYAVDAASGVFFMGRKSQTALSPKGIIEHYKGAQ